MSTSSCTTCSEEETRAVAARLAQSLKGDDKICLVGPLGSGKTTFALGLAQALGVPAGQVASPTFTLIREYDLPSGSILFHVDLYRLEGEDEIFEAGIHELLITEDFILIEWADRLGRFYPRPSIRVDFAHGQKSGERVITITRD